MNKYEDPLTAQELETVDLATAFYTLKICNDIAYALEYMKRNMEKELARNENEVFLLERELVEPYILGSDTKTSASGEIRHITYIPRPLPSEVPLKVVKAVEWLDEQAAINKSRLYADLNEESEPLKESLAKLEEKVGEWFKGQIVEKVEWLNGSKTAILSGCRIKCDGEKVTFEYEEMNYD